MKISFHKYQGTGNDFIILDVRESDWIPAKEQVAFLCDRKFGIGADGLMLFLKSHDSHFSMKYFNSDGRESTMCGNGGRCITSFACRAGIIEKMARFTAVDGEHYGEVLNSEGNVQIIRLKMKDVILTRKDSKSPVILDTGSPHYVVFVEDAESLDLITEARKIRYSEKFHHEGINVDFAQRTGDNKLYVRSYERGVENETLSCGTGVTAAAIAADYLSPSHKKIYRIKTRGGSLTVSFIPDRDHYSDIWLEGPATFVYQGEINL